MNGTKEPMNENEQEIRQALAGAGDANPVLRAMTAVIKQHHGSWLDQAVASGLKGRDRAFAAGAAAALGQLTEALEALRKG